MPCCLSQSIRFAVYLVPGTTWVLRTGTPNKSKSTTVGASRAREPNGSVALFLALQATASRQGDDQAASAGDSITEATAAVSFSLMLLPCVLRIRERSLTNESMYPYMTGAKIHPRGLISWVDFLQNQRDTNKENGCFRISSGFFHWRVARRLQSACRRDVETIGIEIRPRGGYTSSYTRVNWSLPGIADTNE